MVGFEISDGGGEYLVVWNRGKPIFAEQSFPQTEKIAVRRAVSGVIARDVALADRRGCNQHDGKRNNLPAHLDESDQKVESTPQPNAVTFQGHTVEIPAETRNESLFPETLAPIGELIRAAGEDVAPRDKPLPIRPLKIGHSFSTFTFANVSCNARAEACSACCSFGQSSTSTWASAPARPTTVGTLIATPFRP